jgi:hypothetical protein
MGKTIKAGDMVDGSAVYSATTGRLLRVVDVNTLDGVLAEDVYGDGYRWYFTAAQVDLLIVKDAEEKPTETSKGLAENTQPAGLGARANKDKPKVSMVFEAKNAILGCASVLTFGCEKYARANWLQGMEHTGLMDSLLRHVAAWQAGEDIDDDSGLPHVDHILCNALFLSEMTHARPDLDDRPLEILRKHNGAA